MRAMENALQKDGAVEMYADARMLLLLLQDVLQNTVIPTLLQNLAAAPGAAPRVQVVQDPTTVAARTLPTLPPAQSPALPPAMVELFFFRLQWCVHSILPA